MSLCPGRKCIETYRVFINVIGICSPIASVDSQCRTGRFFVLNLSSAPNFHLKWQDYRRFSPRQRPSARLWQWLTLDGSLTQALREQAQGALRVQVLNQSYRRARLEESRRLGLRPNQLCLIREVILIGKNEPWVFARSVIPTSHMSSDFRRLGKQGTTPLGHFLFSHRVVTRSPFEIALISPNARYAPPELLDQSTAYGRRSIFSFNHRHILVSEVYLPAFVKHLAPNAAPISLRHSL